ncbi:MAG TPA: hypothetical protein DCD96_04320 [Flavobacteriales bacterium]|nr:hypothetical protein [Flavobacteriales bacterium]
MRGVSQFPRRPAIGRQLLHPAHAQAGDARRRRLHHLIAVLDGEPRLRAAQRRPFIVGDQHVRPHPGPSGPPAAVLAFFAVDATHRDFPKSAGAGLRAFKDKVLSGDKG